ncbi:MAG: hypothetical protein NTZ16_06050, partial [Verrucomicrobia bacterium]|nr:hypothetical protein [Verrucomicrobiota bacterium]
SNLDFNEILFAPILQYSCHPTVVQQDVISSCRLPRSVTFLLPARHRCSFVWMCAANGWSP